ESPSRSERPPGSAHVARVGSSSAFLLTKASRTRLVRPLINRSFCPDKPILAGFVESFAPCSVSTLAGRHHNADVISLTQPAVNTPHLAMSLNIGHCLKKGGFCKTTNTSHTITE